MMKKIINCFAVTCIFTALVYTSALSGEMPLKPINLPEDKGKEEVEIYCGSGHSLRLVVQQRMKKEAWDERLDWMVDEHGMDKIPLDDRTLVLDYLAKYLNTTFENNH